MAATNADVVGGQFEKVRPKLQEWYETTTLVSGLIRKASESHKISAWTQTLNGGSTLSAFRVPLMRYVGGDYGTFSYDEGDLGGGSSMRVDFMTIGYFPAEYAVEISSLAKEATASSEQAVVDVFKYHLKKSMKEMQHYEDTGYHQDGTGVIATANGTGAPGTSSPMTYNLEPNFGPQRLRYNQPVDVFSNDLTTQRNSGGPARVSSYDLVGKTVTLTFPGSVTMSGNANTDKLAFRGMSPTVSTGSWKLGLYTFNNSATSGTTLGLNRATVPEIVTPNVAAGSTALVPAHGLLLNDQIIQRRDEEALAGMVGIAHQSQRAAVYFTGIAISEWHRGGSDKMIDIVPADIKQSTTFTWTGIKHYVSKKQDRSRIDWIIPKNWGRAMLHDLKFHEVEGRRIFELRSASTGFPKAGMTFYLIQSENVYNCDPGAGGMITGLSLPSGY
jgi:hypothetical protein